MLTATDINRIYGDPGIGRSEDQGAYPAWFKSNIVSVKDMPGLDPTKWFNGHRLVMPHFRGAFSEAAWHAPDYKIKKAGCYSFRHMRHQTWRPLSHHARGIAVDINSDDNAAKTFKRGHAPAAWSQTWNDLWPHGVTKEFVEVWRSCGFRWGGDWDGDDQTTDEVYIDPMHFEYTIFKP